jgi:hypothetical protein
MVQQDQLVNLVQNPPAKVFPCGENNYQDELEVRDKLGQLQRDRRVPLMHICDGKKKLARSRIFAHRNP